MRDLWQAKWHWHKFLFGLPCQSHSALFSTLILRLGINNRPICGRSSETWSHPTWTTWKNWVLYTKKKKNCVRLKLRKSAYIPPVIEIQIRYFPEWNVKYYKNVLESLRSIILFTTAVSVNLRIRFKSSSDNCTWTMNQQNRIFNCSSCMVCSKISHCNRTTGWNMNDMAGRHLVLGFTPTLQSMQRV
jgi:hypothetical protein